MIAGATTGRQTPPLPGERARRWLAALALATLCLPAASLAAGLPAGDHERTLAFGGFERSYLLHVPPRYEGAAVPLVVDLHGFTSNAVQQRAISGMAAVADAKGFLVVYPNGVRNAWNAKLCCGNPDVDDVAFLRAVIDAVAAETPVDRRRIYATGLSNGGAMSHRLACDAADIFAAAAPMAFPLADLPATGCQPSRSIPVLTVMGLTDVLVRYEGGPFSSAAETFTYWRDVNGCGRGTPEVRDARGRSRCEIDTSCAGGVAVGLCSVTARAFPGTSFDGHLLYLNDDYVLAEVAWDFLSQFRLPETVAAPREATVRGTATARLRAAGERDRPVPLEWRVRLGQRTWTAEDPRTKQALTGSWTARGRTGTLRLATAAMPLVETMVGDALGGTGLEVDGPLALRIRLSRAGRPVVLRGRWRIRSGGRAVGTYTIRLRASSNVRFSGR